jgi:hypothetical protein
MLNAFNDEKHEVKAKFKYLMSLVSNESESAFSSYKGRDDEVNLAECFETLERLI